MDNSHARRFTQKGLLRREWPLGVAANSALVVAIRLVSLTCVHPWSLSVRPRVCRGHTHLCLCVCLGSRLWTGVGVRAQGWMDLSLGARTATWGSEGSRSPTPPETGVPAGNARKTRRSSLTSDPVSISETRPRTPSTFSGPASEFKKERNLFLPGPVRHTVWSRLMTPVSSLVFRPSPAAYRLHECGDPSLDTLG